MKIKWELSFYVRKRSYERWYKVKAGCIIINSHGHVFNIHYKYFLPQSMFSVPILKDLNVTTIIISSGL